MPGAEHGGDVAMEFFRTFVDGERLRIAGCLVGESLTLPELAQATGLDLRSLTKHLSRIEEIGLLTVDSDGGTRRYSIDKGLLRTLAASALHDADTTSPTDERGRTLRTFFAGGRLTQMPVQQRKQLYILAELAALFRPGSTYYEAEVNGILQAASPDHYGTLRRMLVDYGLLKRDNLLGGAVYTKGLSIRAVLEANGIVDAGGESAHGGAR